MPGVAWHGRERFLETAAVVRKEQERVGAA